MPTHWFPELITTSTNEFSKKEQLLASTLSAAYLHVIFETPIARSPIR
jgi:hypothetical protein